MNLGLFTDLYELRMLQAYWELNHNGIAVFSLFIRRLPPVRNFLIACGLDDLLGEIAGFRFSADDLSYVAAQGFPGWFLDRLETFRFTGDIHALPEGTPFFANEPILEIVAPIGQAQVLETLVLNQIGFPTLIASKAARIVAAAQGRTVVDFGGRRAHGTDAALKGARAAYIAGVAATSNVMAGKTYGIPLTGTMAHSFIQSFTTETEAFQSFERLFPETTLLVDTYDTIGAVEKVTELAHDRGAAFRVRAVRLDSGDILRLSHKTREVLDQSGLDSVQIFASGGLDEHRIAELISSGAPIDGFGVGTDLMVSADAPAFDIAYKLTEYAGTPRMKLSSGKRMLPGRKQVFRHVSNGVPQHDVLARFPETLSGSPLLVPVMRGGVRVSPAELLSDIRSRTIRSIARLPAELRELKQAPRPYRVEVSESLLELERETARQIAAA
jgi:nicotinate phosphoribosyltransferase